MDHKIWVVRSEIIVGRINGRPIEVEISDNPHKASKLIGCRLDGTPVTVSLRQGRGGVPLNKLASGKVHAVSADSFSPVYEKVNGKTTKKQKVEQDGSLHFSTGACYLISTNEYKSIILGAYYTYIFNGGNEAYVIHESAIESRKQVYLSSRVDVSRMLSTIKAMIDPVHHWMNQHIDGINRSKARKIRNERERLEDDGQEYSGIEPMNLDADLRDGGPTLFIDVRNESNLSVGGFSAIRSTVEEINPISGQINVKSVSPTERIEIFKQSPLFKRIVQVIDQGGRIIFSYASGSSFRTSVSTRKKFSNALEGSSFSGDSFYCTKAQGKWTNSIIGVMHSMHPQFPSADYDVNHFVATIRQRELAMSNATGSWLPYDIPGYDIQASIYSGDIAAIPLMAAQHGHYENQ